jgi:hypothetical protein
MGILESSGVNLGGNHTKNRVFNYGTVMGAGCWILVSGFWEAELRRVLLSGKLRLLTSPRPSPQGEGAVPFSLRRRVRDEVNKTANCPIQDQESRIYI